MCKYCSLAFDVVHHVIGGVYLWDGLITLPLQVLFLDCIISSSWECCADDLTEDDSIQEGV